MKKLLALLAIVASTVVAVNTTAQTTPELITSGTAHTWTGATTGSMAMVCPPGGGACSGGPQPLYDPATNTINFSYGQGNVAQTFAINQALQNAGVGIQVQGYNYTWDIRNLNGDNRQSGTDILTATVVTTNGLGAVRRTDSWTYNTKFDWTTFSGTVNYNNPGPVSDFGNMTVTFSGSDGGFWGGYFGPQVRNVGLTLNYGVDLCAQNPTSSPTCPGYADAVTSQNLFTGTTGIQAYAINQALSFAGAGATIHGFDYGYTYNVPGRDCKVLDIFGFCLTGYKYSDAGVATVITNADSSTIYEDSQTHNGGDNGQSGTYTKSLRFDYSLPVATLGGFAMAPWTLGTASITNLYSRAIYTADPCISNPLSSTSCAGYAQAYHDQQCNINALYDSSCPGYAAAYQTQQCSINSLYNSACPGYAVSYYNQQCTLSPLYDQGCPGYAEAYFNDQCKKNSLFSTKCEGYSTAYAIAYLVPVENSSVINQSLSNTAAADPGKQATQTVKDTNVNNAITPSSTVTPTSATAVNSVVREPNPETRTPPKEEKKSERVANPETREVPKEEKKEVQTPKKTAETKRRAEEAVAEAARARTQQDIVATQTAIVSGMGLLPGFEAYQNNNIVDAQFYKSKEIYANQRTTDNKNAQRFLNGASEVRHQMMIEQQYQLGAQ
jgi:hypothetical protein